MEPNDVRDPGAIFPSLSGDDPGDATALPPGTIPDQEPNSIVRGESLPLTPGPALVEGAAAPTPTQEAQIDAGAAARPPRKTVQDRINQLTRRYHETAEENSLLNQQIAELTQVVAGLQTKISSPRTPAPSPQADLLGGLGSGEPQPPATGAAPVDVANVVTQAIGAYDQKRRNDDAAVLRFRTQQNASFNEAATEFPELNDNRTTARRLFNDLFARSPLAQLPDGPYQVALQVRGIMADEAASARRPAAATVEQRKVQASITTPASTAIPDINRQNIRKEYDKVLAEVRAGKSDYETYRKFRYLQIALNNR
jgi:hypothetical protein